MTSDTEVGQIQVSQYRHPKQVEKKEISQELGNTLFPKLEEKNHRKSHLK